MTSVEPLTLLVDRIGIERYAWLCKTLDATASSGDTDRLVNASEFFRILVERHIDWLASEADVSQPSIDLLLKTAEADLLKAGDEVSFGKTLRILRQRAMLHIVWRSFTSSKGLAETLEAMTTLADFVIQKAVDFAEQAVTARFGQAIGAETGAVQKLIVVGMGKLGGRELNLSSDIDILFIFDEGGVTAGGRASTSNQEYFTRVAQMVIRLIDSVTADGRVFRVDTRLRPFGDSGALVASYHSLENYYQQHGRDWERYALLKSRCITGTSEQQTPFQHLARQFVYRRYTDFSVIDGLRDMKALIDTERAAKGLVNDVKRGAGGIREAEFIVQSYQLVRGGRIPAIQQVGFREALESLVQAQCLDPEIAHGLRHHYQQLRQLEHGVQALRDEQTHSLPTESSSKEFLCKLLGYRHWDELFDAYQVSCSFIGGEFDRLLGESVSRPNLILALDTQTPTIDRSALASLALSSEASIGAVLETFVSEGRLRAMDTEASQRLQKLLPLLVKEVDRHLDVSASLERALSIVSVILKRSAYLSLLTENTQALSRLVDLVARSAPIADKLRETPELLDELLFPKRLFTVPSREDIRTLLEAAMLDLDHEDLEAVMQHLRRFKDAIVFRVAASELEGAIPLKKVSDNLSFLAEVIVEKAVEVAYSNLINRHGEPTHGAEFCVLAYGKLGGIELSYESDLDLVFVSSDEKGVTNGPKPIDHQRFFTRLAQRVIHILSTNMMGGRLYEIDLRLRPNGDSGLLVTSLSALQKYLEVDAWTWERQALVRARPIAGGSSLIDAVAKLRIAILSSERDAVALQADVTSMRQKMREHQSDVGSKSKRRDLKYARGGIVDIEFVVQYLVLRHAARYPEVCSWSDVTHIVDNLEEVGVLTENNANGLRSAYIQLRAAIHRIAMSYDTDDDLAQAEESMAKARVVCAELLPNL